MMIHLDQRAIGLQVPIFAGHDDQNAPRPFNAAPGQLINFDELARNGSDEVAGPVTSSRGLAAERSGLK
jgi:hypothetical protein